MTECYEIWVWSDYTKEWRYDDQLRTLSFAIWVQQCVEYDSGKPCKIVSKK